MKKVLAVALFCAASTFAAWDYFPVIGEDKGEAKIACTQSRQGGGPGRGPDCGDFKIRYSPMANLELMSKVGYVLGARYQIIPTISAGLDIGFPIPGTEWSFTPNAQFSMPLTEVLELGTNGEVTIHTEDDSGLDLSAGVELDLTVGKNIVWIGCDFNRQNLDNKDGGLEIMPMLGYVATAGNLSLGTNVGMQFGKDAGHEKHNTLIGLDASIKF
jgi:hypothetical protein